MARILAAAVVVVVALCCACEVRGKETADVRTSLIAFLTTLAGGDQEAARGLGWDASVDPCGGGSPWLHVTCFNGSHTNAGLVQKIELNALHGLRGTIDAALLCAAPALRIVSLQGNALRGVLPEDVSACSGLTHLYVDGNRLSGALPSSLGQLRRLLVLGVSSNNFSGELPAGLSNVPRLISFLANDNHFDGTIPDFDLAKFDNFNVSNNNLTGPIPKNIGKFGKDSFSGNAGLCGQPLFSTCPSPPSSDTVEGESKSGNVGFR